MEKKYKILHLATDEKFIKAADWVFEQAFPKQNTFIITVPNIDIELKHIDKKHNYTLYQDNDETLTKIIAEIFNYDIVILHSLDYFKSRIVLKAYKKNKFVWMLWGGEVYNNPYIFGNDAYGNATYKRFVKRRFERLRNWFRPLLYLLKYQKYDLLSSIKRAAKKVSAIAILHKEDYDLFLQEGIINGNIKYLKFTYYPIEFIFKHNKDLTVTGGNILLGNSAFPSNNHFEAFDILRQFDLDSRKVITPLSYGREDYVRKIIEIGNEQLGNCFTPLTDFMPLEDYNKIVQSCGITIMNHYRQQAVGNILAMMWMGSKVYLDERNTIYPYLKRIGCKVYSISKDLKPDKKTAFELLSNKEVTRNRTILSEEIGAKSIIDDLRNSLPTIIEANR